MSSRQPFPDDFSRFGEWLARPFDRLREDIRELRAESRRRRRAKERRKADARDRSRMRRSVLGRTLVGMAVFTAVYWGTVILVMNVPVLYSFVESLAVGLFMIIPGNQYLDELPAVLLALYSAVMVIWPLVSLYRTAEYLDGVTAAVDVLTDRERELPPLPAGIGDLDMKLRGIRLTVAENEQLAREAEQRKNDLVVYLAHDLKTPLASVIGYLTLLEEAPDLPVEQRAKYTSITLDKAYRLEQLINEFFDITRFSLQSIEPRRDRIDLSVLLRQIADEFYPVLEEKQLTAELRLPPRLTMTGDADMLMRVFDNLLRNAVSYSYERTAVTVTAGQSGGQIEVSMSNTGDQIPPGSLERLFEKFFRADSARRSGTGGSGLGLAIAKSIVEQHGGQISAVSTPEHTTFHVVLPVSPDGISPAIVRKS